MLKARMPAWSAPYPPVGRIAIARPWTPPQRLQTSYCTSALGWHTLPDGAFLYDLDEDILFQLVPCIFVPDFSRLSVNFAEVSVI
jgi:hypothetical protein